jgi:hypothetical protein
VAYGCPAEELAPLRRVHLGTGIGRGTVNEESREGDLADDPVGERYRHAAFVDHPQQLLDRGRIKTISLESGWSCSGLLGLP